MQTLQRARNVWRLNSQISQDGTFVHYPFFVSNIPLFTYSYRIFSRYLFVLTYFDSSRRHTHATTHVTGTQIVRAKVTSLDAIFCRGNKSSSRSLARFSRRKHKNLPLALRAREKELSSTCRQVYIGTNKSLPFISNLWRNSVDINVQLSDYYTSIKKTTACLSTS